MARREAMRVLAAWLAAALLGLAACAPEGPAEVAWDRVACAHCRMLVSDPRFAAQLQLEDGEVLFFDDPGCLLLARKSLGRAPRAAYFHESTGEGWLAEAETAFLRGATTPMGYGLGAVRADSSPGALRSDEALAALAAGEGLH
jgi:copper chaperone NosL